MSIQPVSEKPNYDKVKLKYIEMRLELEKQNLIDLLPDGFKEDFAAEAYISGGSIWSLYNDKSPKDFDFFIRTERLVIRLRKYFESVAGYHGKVSGGVYKGHPLLITDNAISIGKYQIITRWIGKPTDVCKEFDFKHLMHYYENNKVDTVSGFDFLDTNTLYYNESRARDIVGSVMRLNKFVSRGMRVTQIETAKMLLKLKEVGFSEREVEILDECKQRDDTEHFGS